MAKWRVEFSGGGTIIPIVQNRKLVLERNQQIAEEGLELKFAWELSLQALPNILRFEFTKQVPAHYFIWSLSSNLFSQFCKWGNRGLEATHGWFKGQPHLQWRPLGSLELLEPLNLSQLERFCLSCPCPQGTTSLCLCAGHPPVSVTSSSSDSCGSGSWSACRHVS